MRNAETWKPSKAERQEAGWRASRDTREVMASSRLIADLVIAAYESMLRKHARGVLADIGCGKVPYYGIYRPLVDEVRTIDWPHSVHGSDHIDIACDLNQGIAAPDASFDTVLCTDVIEHIFDPRRIFAELMRVLRADGMLLVGVPFLYWIHEEPHDYHRYTCFALERYAREAGFEVLEITPLGGLPHVLIDLCCKAVRGRPRLAEAVRRLGLLALRLPRVRRSAAASAGQFPLAYLLVARKPSA